MPKLRRVCDVRAGAQNARVLCRFDKSKGGNWGGSCLPVIRQAHQAIVAIGALPVRIALLLKRNLDFNDPKFAADLDPGDRTVRLAQAWKQHLEDQQDHHSTTCKTAEKTAAQQRSMVKTMGHWSPESLRELG